MKREPGILDLPLEVKAEMALKHAVAKVIEEHRRTGQPLVIWKDGQVVLLPPDQAVMPQMQEGNDES
jgi:hypothetical protein